MDREAGKSPAADVRLVPLDHEAARRDVLVLDDVPIGHHRRGPHAGSLQHPHGLSLVSHGAPDSDRPVDLVVVIETIRQSSMANATEILSDDSAEGLPFGVALDRDRHPLVVTRARVDALRRSFGRTVAATRRRRAARGGGEVRVAADRRVGLELRDVDEEASTRAIALGERAEHGDCTVRAADRIGKRHAHLERASARVSRHRGHSRVGLEDRSPGDPHPVRPRVAVTRERDAHDAWVPASERFVIDAEALHAARAVVVEHDVARARRDRRARRARRRP